MRAKIELIIGLLVGTGLLSTVFNFFFHDYIPSFLFERTLGFASRAISKWTGIPEVRVISATQDVAMPVVLALLVVWTIYRFSMWHHARQSAAAVNTGADHQRARTTDDDPFRRVIRDKQYEDLRVLFKSGPPVYDVPIARLVARVATALSEPEGTELYPITRRAIRQAALDGKIKLRGRKQIDTARMKTDFSEVHTDIPPEYWKTSQLNVLVTDERHQSDYHTDPESIWAWGPKGIHEPNRYASLLGNLFEFQKVWK